MEESNSKVFRGFIGGDAFVTKKGYRGLKIDSLWVQNIFDSFEKDDEELASIALQSILADINDQVIGGDYGTPFSIGDYGFYSKNQFDFQSKHLSELERKKAKDNNFLSDAEWEFVDQKIDKIANHGKYKIEEAYKGDTLAMIAIRQSAFNVAKLFLDEGVDPLIENENGEDLMNTMKKQYGKLSLQLREIENFKEKSSNGVVLPSDIEKNKLLEEVSLQSLDNLIKFCDTLSQNLVERSKQIEADKELKRRYSLRNEIFPEHKTWNIAQEDKVFKEKISLRELQKFIKEKIQFHKTHAKDFKSFNDLLLSYHDELSIRAQSPGNSLYSSKSARKYSNATNDSSKLTYKNIESSNQKNNLKGGIAEQSISSEFTQSSIHSEEEINEIYSKLNFNNTSKNKIIISEENHKYKPILGTLKETDDTIIQYR